MPESFFWLAMAAGFGIAAICGPLGSFVIWRRMAYFGDTLSHSSLLGIALGLFLQIHLISAVIISCLAIALLLLALERQQTIPTDTLLGLLAHTSLSLGLVMLSFMEHVRVDLMAYLFGDLLAVQWLDLCWIYGGGSVVILCLIRFWNPLLSMTVNQDIARIEGVQVTHMKALLMLIMSLVIAVAMKFVGALLITSLLIIPAATVRCFSKTPERMAINASFTGALAVFFGLILSWWQNTPAGPSVVVSAFCLFLLSWVGKFLLQYTD